MLTEQDIKTAFLPFLRVYYRNSYEYAPESEQSSLDNVSAEGYVADGMLRFRKPDGSVFTCTYEATSVDKNEEVKFSLNLPYFLWDCAAFGAAMAAVNYGWMFYARIETLKAMTWPAKIGMPLGVALIGFFIWYFCFRNWKKYSYVFALEQFKRYTADEQWVALGADVFPSPVDPYFLELKDQCIYNGFGLGLVYPDLTVRPIAAPARLGVFGADRAMVHWLTRTELYQAMSTNAQAAARMQPFSDSLLDRFGRTVWRPIRQYALGPILKAFGRTVDPAGQAYQRFTGSYTVQKGVLFVSLLAIGSLAYQAAQIRDVVELDRPTQIYTPPPPPPNPEHQDGIVLKPSEREIARRYGEKELTGQYSGVDRQNPIKADYSDQPPFPDYKKNPAEKIVPRPQKSTTIGTSDKIPVQVPVQPDQPNTEISLCQRIKQAGGWLIQDNVFSTQAFAKDRVQVLRKQKIACDYFDAACLGENGWIVRLGYAQSNEDKARKKITEYDEILRKAGLKTGKLLPKKVR